MMQGNRRGVGAIGCNAVLEFSSKFMAIGLWKEHKSSITCAICKTGEKMTHPKAVQAAMQCLCGHRYRVHDANNLVCDCKTPRGQELRDVYKVYECKTCKDPGDQHKHRDKNAADNGRENILSYAKTGRYAAHLYRKTHVEDH